jgi:hypothetical protein
MPATANPMDKLETVVAKDIMKKPPASRASPVRVTARVPNLSVRVPHTILITVSAQKKHEIIVAITTCEIPKVFSIVGTT